MDQKNDQPKSGEFSQLLAGALAKAFSPPADEDGLDAAMLLLERWGFVAIVAVAPDGSTAGIGRGRLLTDASRKTLKALRQAASEASGQSIPNHPALDNAPPGDAADALKRLIDDLRNGDQKEASNAGV
jgi:hypothetical protein